MGIPPFYLVVLWPVLLRGWELGCEFLARVEPAAFLDHLTLFPSTLFLLAVVLIAMCCRCIPGVVACVFKPITSLSGVFSLGGESAWLAHLSVSLVSASVCAVCPLGLCACLGRVSACRA